MPIVNVPGVGQVNFPDDMSHDEIVGAIESDVIPQYKAHLSKTGFMPSLKAAGQEFIAGTQEAFGFDKAAEERRLKAAQAHEAMTEADVKAAQQQGVLSGLGAQFTKEISEPLGGIVGRFGAPIAAGLAAPFVAPEAIGGLAVGSIATALTDLPAEVGENIQRQKEQGQPVDKGAALATGLVQATLAGFGVPGTGALNKFLGPKLLAEAEALTPKILAGKISQEEALASLSSKAQSYAQSVGVNALTGTGLMIGTEELRRKQAGQELMTPEELLQTAKTGAVLAPIFGALHPVGRGAAEAKIGEAAATRQAKLDEVEAKKQAKLDAEFKAQQDAEAEALVKAAQAKSADTLNSLGNFAPPESSIAKSINRMENDLKKSIEQQDINAQKKAVDELTNVPTNIVKLANQPKNPGLGEVTHINEDFAKAIKVAPNAGFLKDIWGKEITPENAKDIQLSLENYPGSKAEVKKNIEEVLRRKEFEAKPLEVKDEFIRDDTGAVSKGAEILGGPERGELPPGAEELKRPGDVGARDDLSAVTTGEKPSPDSLRQEELKFAKQALLKTEETPETILPALKERFGNNVQKAIDRGEIKLIKSDEVPANIPEDVPAYYDKGVAHLITDRLTREDAPRKILHETGAHYALEGMVGKNLYRDTLRTINRLSTIDPVVKAALEHVNNRYKELTPGSHPHLEEVLARVGESAPNHTVWRRIVAAIKDFLLRKGLWNPNKMDVRDIHDLINRSTARALAGKIKPVVKEEIQFAKKERPEPNRVLSKTFKEAGGEFKPDEPTLFQSTKDRLKEIKQDPEQAYKEARSGIGNALRTFETNWFSADAALQRAIRDGMESMGKSWDEIRQAVLESSTGQALHNEGVAHQYLEFGGIKYDPSTFKWRVEKGSASWKGITDVIKKAATTHKVPYAEMEQYAHKYLEALRLKQAKVFNQKIKAKAEEMANEGRSAADVSKFLYDNTKVIHMTDAQIAAAEKLGTQIPQLKEVQKEWNKVREDVIKFAVDTGLYTRPHAEELLDTIDYVPFYRVEQLEAKAGPKEYSRGLLDAAREHRFKGSTQEVNNVFDNMERWITYTIRKGINNKAAQNLADAAERYLPDEVRRLDDKETVARGMESNTVGIWRDGNRVLYEFKDPLYVHAFTGIESIAIPALKGFAKFTDLLRKNIVLNPLFSAGQLTQDAFGAMFTSGVRHPLAIPVEVFKEFYRTLAKTSATHEELRRMGAVGVKDYSANISRIEAEIAAGLRDPSLMQRIKKPFETLSMASDNAVRQAVYNRTLLETGGKRMADGSIQGGDKAKAIERAFELINFRRAGASKNATFMRQTVPFFGAYLQSMNVAAKVISGRGVAPEQKAEAHKVLAMTAAKVAALSLIYNAVVSEDEDYKKLDPSVRDRHLIIPYSGGLSIPLRPDIFTLFSKILPEHIYQMTMAEATEDSTKAKKAMGDALSNALLGPNPLPQAVKPIIEVATNHNFFTGRPIVGQGVEQLDVEKQYSANTSELAKVLGHFGISPMKADHLLKAYFGYTAGLGLMATDSLITAASDKVAPEKSFQDWVASIPGMSAFVTKEFGTREANDYYELKEQVDKAVNTLNYLKTYGTPEERKAYREEHKDLLRVKSQINRINENLANLRKRERIILEAPESKMSAEVKGEKIREIKLRRQKMLAHVDELRKKAGF